MHIVSRDIQKGEPKKSEKLSTEQIPASATRYTKSFLKSWLYLHKDNFSQPFFYCEQKVKHINSLRKNNQDR